MSVNKRLEALGIVLPKPLGAGALYTPVKQSGTTLYVSGQIPLVDGKPAYTGKVGNERTLEEAQQAARICIYNMLSAVQDYVKDLDKVKGVLKIFGLVQSDNGFDKQHLVINVASQILIDVFGDEGWHARSAVGTNQLPMNVTVEIEGIFELK
ncbi:MAG: RidA family protein [Firmicutes bacterium]|nr:RidA family protein [Bacillota bacterium]